MTWFSAIVALIKLASALASWAHERKLISDGQAAFIADTLKEQADAIETARKARDAQRARDIDGVHDDAPDKHRRD